MGRDDFNTYSPPRSRSRSPRDRRRERSRSRERKDRDRDRRDRDRDRPRERSRRGFEDAPPAPPPPPPGGPAGSDGAAAGAGGLVPPPPPPPGMGMMMPGMGAAMAGMPGGAACNPQAMAAAMAMMQQQQQRQQMMMQMGGGMAGMAGMAGMVGMPGMAGMAGMPGMAGMGLPGMAGLGVAGGVVMPAPNSKKQREVYVGNLPQGMTEPVVRELFTQVLQACEDFNTASGPPVINVQLCGGGQYAFVEFRDEECCETAMQFGGMVLSGKSLKVNHPNGYLPSPIPVRKFVPPADLLQKFGLAGVATPAAAPNLLPDAAGAVRIDNKKARELYVGNLAVGMVSAQMLKELFTAPLLTLPDSTGVVNPAAAPPVLDVRLDPGGKFAFLELRDEPMASMALQLFNGMDLCGRGMKVARPSGYVPAAQPGGGAGGAMGGFDAAAAASQALSGLMPGQMGGMPAAGGMAAAGVAALGSLGLPAAVSTGPPPSRKLKLENMFAPEQLLPSEEADFKECVEDISNECERFGGVEAFAAPRPHDLQGHPPDAAGQCFVTYTAITSAVKAREALDGRDFDGRSVKATFVPEA